MRPSATHRLVEPERTCWASLRRLLALFLRRRIRTLPALGGSRLPVGAALLLARVLPCQKRNRETAARVAVWLPPGSMPPNVIILSGDHLAARRQRREREAGEHHRRRGGCQCGSRVSGQRLGVVARRCAHRRGGVEGEGRGEEAGHRLAGGEGLHAVLSGAASGERSGAQARHGRQAAQQQTQRQRGAHQRLAAERGGVVPVQGRGKGCKRQHAAHQ